MSVGLTHQIFGNGGIQVLQREPSTRSLEDHARVLSQGFVGQGRTFKKVRMIPITRDQASWSAPGDDPTSEMVRLAQREVGALLWLVTRTHPDIMFAVAKLSSLVTRDPKEGIGDR